ncbi:MAG: M13 family metallopeptidase [Dysgonamonadaceae bacterium]|jgi:putative endopeptidase|nr:M13 family metallopeptidase [Dysgonamonadaceae bacterium]
MKKQIIFLAIIVVTLSACKENKKETVKGISLENLDPSAVPGNDFYQFACGGWLASNPLKPEYARFGTFDALREKSREQVKNLINELSLQTHQPGSVAQKIGDLYALAMDSVRLNAEGATPLLPYLNKLQAVSDKSELTAVLAGMFRDGMSPFFHPFVSADDRNSAINIFHLYQGGYSLPDRDYYLEKTEKATEIRTKYIELVEQLFVLSGYAPEEAAKASAATMAIETQLAKAAFPREKLRDPVMNYHKITVEELARKVSCIDWPLFFQTIGIKGIQELNLSQAEPLSEVNKVLASASLTDIKYYLSWNAILASSSFLSDAYSDATFEFFGKTLSGKEQQQERWKRAVNVIDGGLGEAVGQFYVEKYFPPAAKEKMLNLVQNLQVSLSERITNLPWMSEETKEKAQEKLGVFHVKIGYPDKWRDYSKLDINVEESYVENIVRSNNFDFDYMIGKFNQPVDRDEWFMNPQTVNAYYNPTTNEICFPAAILQPPFFNIDADDAVNYGAIGVVIGHEMTHAFDDQGRQYDKDGNLKDWWTAEDANRFKERAQVLVDCFDRIVVLDTVHANGRYTLGENIADQGGLQVSWQAYQNTLKGKETPAPIDGYTDAQRFFLGYATVWASNIRDAEILRLTKVDPHSLAKWRVNGALPQVDAWYDAFDITPDQALYVPKENRVAIW